ncbi:hypothetical protein E4U21_002449 [Claviceps maximensis]|nr:hypothetical protein E4U21_002449 [Claviceps maximensis]
MAAAPRASAGLLRNRIKVSVPSRAVRASPRYMSATQVSRVKDDLGGPGGQQPPPGKPGGYDVLRQQWLKIGGGALLLVAAYAYFSGGTSSGSSSAGSSAKEAAKRSALNLERNAERKMGGTLSHLKGDRNLKEDVFEASRNVAAQTSDQAGKTMRELSGRDKTKEGSFRHE